MSRQVRTLPQTSISAHHAIAPQRRVLELIRRDQIIHQALFRRTPIKIAIVPTDARSAYLLDWDALTPNQATALLRARAEALDPL